MGNNTTLKCAELISEVRSKKPLVHHITNYVTVNDCANIVLAIGASPIMADDIGEVEDIVSISSVLVINIGTLNSRTINSMIAAGKKANELKIPVVLDPVGAGASPLRNDTVNKLISEIKFSVIRGNMSEIRFISGLHASTRGVDASEADVKGTESGIQVAEELAEKLKCVVAITGAVDYVSDGIRTVSIKNGHPMLSSVTGTGCMCTSLIGSFCGATRDYFLGAVSGISSMGIAGETAFEKAGDMGTSSFRTALIDSISKLDSRYFESRSKIDEI
ncbi:MAG: hydroxyethylthiazole kinase [Bacillota bacterium]|nr:hydroxyethylthiazole kinase [Bacillota bacterium]